MRLAHWKGSTMNNYFRRRNIWTRLMLYTAQFSVNNTNILTYVNNCRSYDWNSNKNKIKNHNQNLHSENNSSPYNLSYPLKTNKYSSYNPHWNSSQINYNSYQPKTNVQWTKNPHYIHRN